MQEGRAGYQDSLVNPERELSKKTKDTNQEGNE